jgi:hypothetical protein
MPVKKIIRFTITAISLLIVIISSGYSQLTGFQVSAGLSTIEILGNNIARYPLVWDTKEGKIYGGSFDQSQNGIRLESIFSIDESEVFEVPLGIEYHFYRGRERQPISEVSDIKFRHDADVATITLGVSYSFYEIMPFQLKAKFYAGLETRTAIIFQGKYESSINYSIDKPEVISYSTKETAIRFGSAILLGMTGEINKDVSVDFRGGLGMMNLIGKDDERGELLTPRKKTGDYEEAGETSIFNFHFAMLLRFRI